MKTLLYSVTLTLTVILVGCEKTIDESELVERKDIHYQINSDKPFTGSVFSYHDNGQVKTSGTYKKGLKEGLFEEFYDNGQLLSSVNYFMGEKEGVENIYFENGNIHFIKNYKNNLLTGVKETYFENGQLKLRENYENGEFEEKIIRYDEDGNEILIISYSYDDDYNFILSKSSEVICKIGDNIIREGKVDGDQRWEYLRKKNEEPFSGIIISYYDNGKIEERFLVENGLMGSLLWEMFYESGKIQYRDHNGLSQEFYEDGSIKSRYNYIYVYDITNNKDYWNKNGLLENFDVNGDLESMECYQNNEEVDMSFCEEK